MAVKKVKKSAEAAPAKAKNGKASAEEEGMVSLNTLASEFKISPQRARQKLRAAKLARERGARWKWKDGSKDLAAARKALAVADSE